jgi:nitric oxide reductase large subunit
MGGAFATHGKEPPPVVPDADPLRGLKPTPSMKATAKYFWVVTALIVVQILLGHASLKSTQIYTHLTEPLRQDLRRMLGEFFKDLM